jgi:hypothetical protein
MANGGPLGPRLPSRASRVRPMAPWLALLAVVVLAIAAAGYLISLLRSVEAERRQLAERFKGVLDADAEAARVRSEIAAEQHAARTRLEEMVRTADAQRRTAEDAALRAGAELSANVARRDQLAEEIAILDEQAHLFSFGLYTPRFDCSSSAEYATRLEQVRAKQKQLLKDKKAAVADAEWSVNGSKTEGRKQINQTLKLMLRAFNGECDAAVAKVRYNNVQVMEARIEKAFETVNSLAQVQQCRITRDYLQLKLDELHLEHEYEEKVQAEKEEQRRIREQMRDEEIAQRQLEKARLDAEKEELRAADALEKARREVADAVGARQARLQAQIEELERRLAAAHEQKERAISQAQLTRSGHVYVISNVGSFGENVYKVGMTRRLDPLERIRELGDASVPFEFDVHAVIYSDDAPALESVLHRTFTKHRVNRVNERKEFFRVSIEAIAEAVRQHHGAIEFTLAAEAPEYRKTVAILDEELRAGVFATIAGAAPASLPFASPPASEVPDLTTAAAFTVTPANQTLPA